jgi:hypothetical protein
LVARYSLGANAFREAHELKEFKLHAYTWVWVGVNQHTKLFKEVARYFRLAHANIITQAFNDDFFGVQAGCNEDLCLVIFGEVIRPTRGKLEVAKMLTKLW